MLRLLPATTASSTNLVRKKPISGAKPAHFDFFTINCTSLGSQTEHMWRCCNTLPNSGGNVGTEKANNK